MRDSYRRQLETLHTELIKMGAYCEEAIEDAMKGLLDENPIFSEKAIELEKDIDSKEKEIESFCMRLLLREQPVAGDLRQIMVAHRIIHEMERIGDQAADISELAVFLMGKQVKSDIHIAEMAKATTKMLTNSVDSFVTSDLKKAKEVIAYDDQVDALFVKIKNELINLIFENHAEAEACLDLLMIAKYFERIGDHAQNVAEWVVFSITGERGGRVKL